MNSPAEKISYTYAEYLSAEEKSETKHEWLNGEIFAMSGGTPEHALLCASVNRCLGIAVRGKRCAVFSSDLRVRVQATGLSTYPDVSVVCGQIQRAPDDKNAVVNPILLAEVLSDSTEVYDRGEKASHYRRIPSLREYMLVSQSAWHIEVYRRTDEGEWKMLVVGAGERFYLESVDCYLSVDEVYWNPLG